VVIESCEGGKRVKRREGEGRSGGGREHKNMIHYYRTHTFNKPTINELIQSVILRISNINEF